MKKYLKKVGLQQFEKDLEGLRLNNFVNEAFVKKSPILTNKQLKKLFFYDTPKLGPGGSCSISKEKEDLPYNLALTLGLDLEFSKLRESTEAIRIWKLYQVVQKVMKEIKPDWFGIYRKIKKKNGEEVLVKEAYSGNFSRAEFPLTGDFAKQSNNSTVGLTGKVRHFSDLTSYNGPYYECDNQVQSEYCGPILDKNGKVIGIVDAESFKKNFFTSENILQLTKVCQDLGEINLGSFIP